MLIQMKVEGMLFDPRSNMYILLLKEADGTGTLPIWIGKPEADSIALALGKVATPRPLTHDLIKNLIEGLHVRVTKIVVTEIIDNAITRTMSRTIITHGSTQLAVLSMLMFGGETLHYFALALTIGILFGIYSSVLVASPIVMWLGLSREDMLPAKKEVGEVDTRP